MYHWIDKTKNIIEIIAKHGGKARYVGGCVRDSLIGKKVKDIDIATNLLPKQVEEVLNNNNIRTIPTGLKHGTITALINNVVVEITTLRRDIVCDGRHAKVEYTLDWHADAQRRDFTFNALYADEKYEIFDYFEGKKDLLSRTIRFVGNPDDRITEDYLRILRVFRFHAALECVPLSEDIIVACTKHAHNISILSGERIQGEMMKLLSFSNHIKTIKLMQKCGVLSQVIPGGEFLLDSIDVGRLCTINDPIVNLAIILRSSHGPQIFPDAILKRWKIPKKHYKMLNFLALYRESIDGPKHIICLHGAEYFKGLIQIYYVENKLSEDVYDSYCDLVIQWKVPEFPISGKDILSLGIGPGKDIGITLDLLKNHWHQSEWSASKLELMQMAEIILKQ